MATFCSSNQLAINYISSSDTNVQTLITNIKNGTALANSGTVTDEALYNRLITILNLIYNYGSYGTRTDNPGSIPATVEQDTTMSYTKYNQMLTSLSTPSGTNTSRTGSNIEAGTQMTATQINNLGSYLKAYKFNSNRCNSCNTSQGGGCGYSSGGGYDSCYGGTYNGC